MTYWICRDPKARRRCLLFWSVWRPSPPKTHFLVGWYWKQVSRNANICRRRSTKADRARQHTINTSEAQHWSTRKSRCRVAGERIFRISAYHMALKRLLFIASNIWYEQNAIIHTVAGEAPIARSKESSNTITTSQIDHRACTNVGHSRWDGRCRLNVDNFKLYI